MQQIINEKVATSNATTIMSERMIDLLTNNTRIMDYVDSSDIEITTDFENGWVEVEVDGCFILTYYMNSRAFVNFNESSLEFIVDDLDNITEMLECYESVENIFHTIKNVLIDKKTQLFISTTIGDEYDADFECVENPIQRAREIKDMWLANMALQGYDTPNAEINEDETFITINVNKENESARLHLSWE